MTVSFDRRTILGGMAGLVAAPLVAPAHANTRVRFAVDWVWQGNHSPWTLAQDKGHFAANGVEAVLDRGYGSADNITKLAAGSLDMALVDPNLLPRFNQENPDSQLMAVFIVYDAAPSAVTFLKSSGIVNPKDLEGRRVAATEGDATRVLFPVFAERNDIDINAVQLLAVTPQLRDAMVVQGEADASLGFLVTAVLNIEAAGVPADNISYFQYSQHGLELYSLSLVCRRSYAEANPDVVRGFIKATIEGVRTMLAEPEEAIASVIKRNGLLDKDVEARRNDLMNETSLLTPQVREHGMSVVDPERFDRSMEQVVQAFGLTKKPALSDVYTEDYLPPVEERRIA